MNTTSEATQSQLGPEQVFERLIAINREIDRKLEQHLRQQGITWEQFVQSAEAASKIPEEDRAILEGALLKVLPPPDVRFSRINDPEPSNLTLQGRQLLRI